MSGGGVLRDWGDFHLRWPIKYLLNGTQLTRTRKGRSKVSVLLGCSFLRELVVNVADTCFIDLT